MAVQRVAVTMSEEELIRPKGLIPFMVVVQDHKQKVWLVLDYRELNDFVTANAEVYSQRLSHSNKRQMCRL